YLVLRKGPGDSDFTPQFASGLAVSTSSTTYLDTVATSHVAYQYEVVTVDTAGNQGPPSIARVITRDDATPPPDCTGLTGVPGNGVVTLQWPAVTNSPPDMAGYFVYRKVGNGPFGSPLNAFPILDAHYEDLG